MTFQGRTLQLLRNGWAGVWLMLLLLVLLPALSTVGADEISDGRFAVRLEPTGGRVSLFAIDESRDRRPLLFASDPRTSVLSVREDNRIHRMGDSAGFSRTTEVLPGSVAIAWSSPTLDIEQRFTTANGIEGSATVDIRVRNRSAATRRIALRYLLDTWLGEGSGVHFVTSTGKQIRTETRIEPDAANRYWVSMDEETSLYYVFSGAAGTEAEAVVFANWKRLSDARWDYRVVENRSFDLIPYAMNDSAAAVYYPERVLDPGSEYHVRFLIGVGERAPDVALPSVASEPTVAKRPAARPAPDAAAVRDSSLRAPQGPEERRIVAELSRINALLQDINRELLPGRELVRRRVDLLEERLHSNQGANAGGPDRSLP